MIDSSEGPCAPQVEMPRYVSHKRVWALEIKWINRTVPGKVTLSFVDKGYAPLTFDETDPMLVRYAPIQRDFYVVYNDGYKSLSPRKAFIEGYTRESIGAQAPVRKADPAEEKPDAA